MAGRSVRKSDVLPNMRASALVFFTSSHALPPVPPLQGIIGSVPYTALIFLTLYLQLMGGSA